MKFLDFTSLLNGDPASLAIFSTFQLDPDFFERRILRCPVVAKARRIIVFMDSVQWGSLLLHEIPARFINRRYLVVPVRAFPGVFHPKLNMFVTESSGLIQCGSNNLTRAGCSSNLELLNAIRMDPVGDSEESTLLAGDSIGFFKRACDYAELETGRIAREWLDEAIAKISWLTPNPPRNTSRKIRLVHSYEGNIWDRLATAIDELPSKRLLVISPFHDADAEIAKRVLKRWPGCKVEFVVQERTTSLPVSHLKQFRSRLRLSVIRNSSRRLHAKLIAWETKEGTSCLVGSANFTVAALSGSNVEACLLVSDASSLVSSLFDNQLRKETVSFEDFEPGTEQEPIPIDIETNPLRLISAVLIETGDLRVTYQLRFSSKPSTLQLAIRTPEEKRHRVLMPLPIRENGTATLAIPDSALRDVHGTILASLVAEIGNDLKESAPVWIVQKIQLTYEPNGEVSSDKKSIVEETGMGLTEILEEIGKRDGITAIIEYLRHLNIRFNDGGANLPGQRKFRLRITDPFRPDVAPGWLTGHNKETNTLAEAIYEFVDRHENRRLRRHANRGNINGMENFLDIFTALIRLLYVYYVRGIVQRYQLIGRMSRYLEVATSGVDDEDEDGDHSEGYLRTVFDNLDGNSHYLQEVIDEVNFLGHLVAALVIVQKVRFVPGERLPRMKSPERPSECLPTISEQLKSTIRNLRLKQPSKQEVEKALLEYNMFTEAELAELEKEIAL